MIQILINPSLNWSLHSIKTKSQQKRQNIIFSFVWIIIVRLIFIIKMEQTDRTFIDDMTKMIIRPHRDIYTIEKLGPPQMIVKGRSSNNRQKPSFKYIEITRKDLAIDCKGKKIQMSYFAPSETQSKKNEQNTQQNKNRRCVVYLHANSGSRMQGLDLVKYILPFGWSMAIFDYRGSGVSDGDYTSMGVNESQDLQKVLQHLGCHQRISEYCLWGRSMGAVTILYYLTKQYYWNNLHSGTTIRAVVLDSPFSNMQKLMYDVGSSKINLPDFVFTPVINSIMERITMKLGFNLIKELDLIERVKQLKEKNIDSYKLMSKISALFITSLQDKLVNSSHVEALHQHFPFHPKDLHYFNGQHNENRSDTLKNKCAQFLCQIPEKKEQQRSSTFLLRKSELDMRKVLQEPPRKELQFVLSLKKDVNSPKFKAKKEFRAMTDDPRTNQKQIKTSKIMEEAKNIRSQNQSSPQTIIINNNYNVSVNLFDSKQASTELSQQIIPPINFRGDQTQGFMTDRLKDNHMAHKYFGPYTAKVQKRQYDHSNHVPITFNISSPTSSGNQNISLFHKTEANKTNQKEQPSTQVSKVPQNSIDIPRIKFQGINYNIEKQQQARQRLSSRDLFERQKKVQNGLKIGPPPQFFQQPPMYSSQNPRNSMQLSEKTKLSLAQLRKLQKQQQQKCVMKKSKVISIKDRSQHSQQFHNFYLKSEGNQLQQSLKDKQRQKTQNQGVERLSSTGSREIRSLKTSLMQKRQAGNPKNSQTSQTMKTSYMNKMNKRVQDNKEQLTSPQKVLQYKFKIDHL